VRSGIYRQNEVTIAVQPAANWANRRYMQSFFGVMPSQAGPSMTAYAPDAAFKDVRGGIVGEYNLTQQWALATSLQYVRKVGAALHSPIVATRGSYARLNSGVFALYTF